MGSKNKPVPSPPKQELDSLLLDGQSMRGIGRNYRVSVGTVGKWFDYNKLNRLEQHRSNVKRLTPFIPKVIDKITLLNLLNIGYLITEISRELKVNRTLILKSIKFHGLKRNNRSISIPITENALEFLDGLLAGDGYYDRDSNSTSKLTLGTSFHIYAEEVAKELVQHKIPVTIDVFKDEARSTGYNFVARTPKILELRRQRLRWYPEPDCIKRVPRDIKDTPTMWKWLYVGDGTLLGTTNCRWARKCGIATDAFPEEDVKFLCELLNKRGFDAYYKPHNKPYQFQITINKADKFLEFIGEPIKSFEYKWNIPKKVTKYCRWCSKKFIIKYMKQVFCTHKCYKNWHEAPRGHKYFNPIPKNLNYVFGEQRLCRTCGIFFEVTRNNKVSCSRKCRDKFSREKNGS